MALQHAQDKRQGRRAVDNDEEPRVRIGLIGAGAIMRLSHAPVIRQSGCAELVAVYDADPARAAALTAEHGGRVERELQALCEAPDVDAVVVATPNRHHPEGVLAAAAAGKHVLCEKPLAIDVASAQRMVQACEQAGVLLQVGFNQRFWEQVRIARTLIEEGVIGEVIGFRSIYAERHDAYPAATRYRYDLAQSGGATIIDLTIHRIDLARHLLGEVTGICAELTHSTIPDPVDDNVWLLARFASGARGCLSSDRYSPAIGDGTDIYGTEGTIHLATETLNPFHAAPLAVYTERKPADLPAVLREAHYPEAWWKSFEGGWLTVKPPRRNPYVAQLAAFCRSIRRREPALVSGMDGLKAQEVIQAAYLSVRDRGWIDLPLPHDAPFVLPPYT
jgi:predicted dehydrogenase